MLETLLILAAANALRPIVKRICEGENETNAEDTTDTNNSSGTQCDGYYSERPSSERQTTLNEFGF